MGERRCRYCEKNFQPSKYQPLQVVCSDANCQQRRRREYHRQKLTADPEYRQVCRDSSHKWRAENPGYWKGYREKNPDSAAHNREEQKKRDRKRRLLALANNNSALDLKHAAASVWLLNAPATDLANNNLFRAQVWVIEPLPRRKGPAMESCKQQRAGLAAGFAG
jgi:hypothetical protein